MILIGLTGSIGMGKTTTAKLFADEGVPVWDADAAVHRLYAPGGLAVPEVLAAFPHTGSMERGIDREALSAAVLGEPERLERLEAIVHPLVRRDQEAFIERVREAEGRMVLLDIPLLAENGMAPLFHEVVVVTADEESRRRRVLERPGMTEDKLASILGRQAGEEERLALADHVIRTDRGIDAARQAVRDALDAIREKHGLPPQPERE